MTERQFQAAACRLLDATLIPRGGWYTAIPGGDRQQTRAPGYQAGTPDLVLIWRGRALFVELKAPKGRVSEAQAATHKAIERASVPVIVCRTLDELHGTVTALTQQAGLP